MASLTGNKIKDTYTSLLKVGDNGTIDSSAQALTDGAGNALGLTLTNGGVIVSTTNGTLIGTSDTNVVGASLLNISGNGTAGQLIQSDGDGSFSYVDASTGDITGVTAGDGLTGGGTSGAVSLAVNVDDSTIELNSDAVRVKDLGISTAKIANDGVTYAKLGAEFTTSAALSGTEVNWASAQVFTKTLSGDTTLTFTGVETGMQINLVISGNHSLTLPSSVKELTNADSYDGSGENLISIVSTNGNTEQFATINKVA
jgi:hypothetical protein